MRPPPSLAGECLQTDHPERYAASPPVSHPRTCRRAPSLPTRCTHKQADMPRWLSSQKLEIIKALLADDPALLMRESKRDFDLNHVHTLSLHTTGATNASVRTRCRYGHQVRALSNRARPRAARPSAPLRVRVCLSAPRRRRARSRSRTSRRSWSGRGWRCRACKTCTSAWTLRGAARARTRSARWRGSRTATRRCACPGPGPPTPTHTPARPTPARAGRRWR